LLGYARHQLADFSLSVNRNDEPLAALINSTAIDIGKAEQSCAWSFWLGFANLERQVTQAESIVPIFFIPGEPARFFIRQMHRTQAES